MTDDQQILRRQFIAIATDEFEASGTFAKLDVGQEVMCLRRWLADGALAERRFDDQEYADLAHRPSYAAISDRLRKKRRFTDADAVVVYVTGHGITAKDRSHRIVLQGTDPRDYGDSLRTSELIEWLAAHEGLNQVLLVVDVCQAGQLMDDLPATLQRELPPEWIALLTAAAGVDAKLGAFTGVVEAVIQELRDSSDDADRAEPYLESDVFIKQVKHRLKREHGQDLVVLRDPYQPSVCLPNPGYDAQRFDRVATSRARRDLAILQQDMAAHWAMRAPVAASQGGPVFTGRARLMGELIAFATGPSGTLVVGGRAGCGKSAALARLVTCSDAGFRAKHAEVIAEAQPAPPEDAVDIAVLATGKTSEQIAQQIGGALGIEAPRPGTRPMLESWVEAVVLAISAAGQPLTIVVDALDEATDPGGVVMTVLERLSARDRGNLRLLVGVRSSGSAARGGESRDLASVVTAALGARQIVVDDDDLWEPDDLRSYVEQVLTQPGSTYEAGQNGSVAEAVAAAAGRSYLLAGLTARALAELEEPLPAGDSRLDALLAQGAGQLVAMDLRGSVPNPEDRRRAMVLLRASALAQGLGAPSRMIWPLLATAIASDDLSFGDSDVAWLLGHRLSGYLVRDVEDGLTVFRPFHHELRGVLAEGIGLDGEGNAATVVDIGEAHRRIAAALQALAQRGAGMSPRPPHPYARRHLAAHAAAGGRLHDLLNLETLPYVDQARLSTLLRLTEVDPNSPQWLVLSAWRYVRHRWSWDDPDANAAALDVAYRAAGGWLDTPPRRTASGLQWKPRWAEWQFGGTVIAGDGRSSAHLAFGDVERVPILVTAEVGRIRLWDCAAGQLLGEPLTPPSGVEDVAITSRPGRVVAAGDDGRVMIWDAVTRRPLESIEFGEETLRALAVGEMDGGQVVAAAGDHRSAGGFSGSVQVRRLDGGALIREFVHTGRWVTDVALANAPGGGLFLAMRYSGDDRIEVRDVRSGGLVGPPVSPAWGNSGGEIALGHMGDNLVLAAGAGRDAHLWDVSTGHERFEPLRHFGAVSSVALTSIGDTHLLATAGVDGTVQVWNAEWGSPVGPALLHPGQVWSVAFGEVDGRTMLATACGDGITRLWDPIQASGARVAVKESLSSVALDGEVVVGGTEDGRARIWDTRSGQPLPAGELEEPGDFIPSSSPDVEVHLACIDGRHTLITEDDAGIEVWDISRPAPNIPVRLLTRPTAFQKTAVHVDAGRVVMASFEDPGPLRLIDLLADQVLFETPLDDPWSLTFVKAQGRALLAALMKDHVDLLDPSSGQAWRYPRQTWQRWYAAAGTIDDVEILAILDGDGVRIHALGTGEPTLPPIEIPGTPNGIAFGRLGDRDLLLTAHFATIRVWNPRTGRKVAELPFGTKISGMNVHQAADDSILVAVGGPGVVVVELREVPA